MTLPAPRIATLAATLLAAVLIGGLIGGCSDGDEPTGPSAAPTTDPFYASPPTVDPAAVPGPEVAPGTIARSEPIDGLPDDHLGWRILYWTRDAQDRPVIASGMVLRPAEPPDHGELPLVAWAHQSTGVADACAPSRSGNAPGPAILSLLDAGVAVAAADYEGLGVVGLAHPYMDGTSAARSVLDSARAARLLPGAQATGPVGVWGYSQGGQAALFAAQHAASYAPELGVVGVAASAPPSQPSWIEDSLHDEGRFQFALFAISGWSDRDELLDPGLILTDDGVELAEKVRDDAAVFCPDPNGPVEDDGLDALVHSTFEEHQRWLEALAITELPPLPAAMPVLVLHGRDDEIVPIEQGEAAARTLCAAGSTVEFRELDGDHRAAMLPDLVVDWLTRRSWGIPATTTCGLVP
ncbi:MAG TPA: lipase family protein [Microthrixaceae bacterium]|nr:lipase family protein [Microthrixaceae bacterium]